MFLLFVMLNTSFFPAYLAAKWALVMWVVCGKLELLGVMDGGKQATQSIAYWISEK